MLTQTSNIAVPVDGRQELVLQLQRDDLESCPLGTVGNLKINAGQGGPAPASRGGAPLSEMSQPLADRRAGFNAYFTCARPQTRAQREALAEARVEVRANSLLIGNLLGSLTAPPADLQGHVIISQALLEVMARSSDDSFYSLKGAEYCLITYLDELKESDLAALRHGLLSHEQARQCVLDKIAVPSDDALRMRASRMLGDIAEAVNQRMARHAVHEPLMQIVASLAASPVDGHKLHAQLMRLPDGLNIIRRYLKESSTDEFKLLLGSLRARNPDAARRALSQITGGGPSEAGLKLFALRTAIDLEFSRRVPPVLLNRQRNLDWQLSGGNTFAVSKALYRLGLAVEDACQVYGMLSNDMDQSLRQQVWQSMTLFRDDQNNPTGPLNGHSLSKLDDGIRANLGGAASVLHSWGLVLKPEAV